MYPDPSFADFSVHIAPKPDGGTDVAVFGELDLATVAPVERALAKAIAQEGTVVIDLRACDFVDSAGIGVLIKAALRLHGQDRKLLIRGVKERVMRILDLTGVAEIDGLEIEPQADRLSR